MPGAQARNKHITQGERTLTFDSKASLVVDDAVPRPRAGTNRAASSSRAAAAAVLVEEPDEKNQAIDRKQSEACRFSVAALPCHSNE